MVNFDLPSRGQIVVQLRGQARVLVNQLAFTKADETAGGSGTIAAPMHGNLIEVFVSVGDTVEPGQDLAVMEAMKMEHRLRSQVSGEVVAIHATAGEQVASGAIVLEIAVAD
jgi:geranyl-CoA carboxylase alpha subunit